MYGQCEWSPASNACRSPMIRSRYPPAPTRPSRRRALRCGQQLRHSALTHAAEDGTNTPILLARSRHASVRSLKRYARPGREAVPVKLLSTTLLAADAEARTKLQSARCRLASNEAACVGPGDTVSVAGVDARDGHADSHLTGGGLRVGQFAHLENIGRRALPLIPGRIHSCCLLPLHRFCCVAQYRMRSPLSLPDRSSSLGGKLAPRPTPMGSSAAISTGHPLSTLAGTLVLQQGGNAVDAAVAAALAGCVLQSDMVSFAGIACIQMHNPASRETLSITGVGHWPARASLEELRATWAACQRMCVTESCLAHPTRTSAPWNDLARGPSHASPSMPLNWRVKASPCTRSDTCMNASAQAFSLNEHRAPAKCSGRTVDQFGWASCFANPTWPAHWHRSRLRKQARWIACRASTPSEKLFTTVISLRGSTRSLLKTAATFGKKICAASARKRATRSSGTFGDFEIAVCPFWSKGPMLLEILNMLAEDDVRSLGHNSAAYIHLLTEALKLAFADRHAYYGDPGSWMSPRTACWHRSMAEHGVRSFARPRHGARCLHLAIPGGLERCRAAQSSRDLLPPVGVSQVIRAT